MAIKISKIMKNRRKMNRKEKIAPKARRLLIYGEQSLPEHRQAFERLS